MEFHLLEWYRDFYSLEELMQELYELIVFLHSYKDKESKKQKYLSLNKKNSYEIPPAEFVTVSELFDRYLQFSLTPQTSKQELFNLSKKEALAVREDFSF